MSDEFDSFNNKRCRVTYVIEDKQFFMKGQVSITSKFVKIIDNDREVLVDKQNITSIVFA